MKKIAGFVIFILVIVIIAAGIVYVVNKENKKSPSPENKSDLPSNVSDVNILNTAIVNLKNDGASTPKKEKILFVARSKEELDKNLDYMDKSIITQEVIDKIDFSTQMVVFATSGEKPTGGNEVEIKNITEDKLDINIEVNISEPGDKCITTAQITSPFHFLVVRKIDKDFYFRTNNVVKSCE